MSCPDSTALTGQTPHRDWVDFLIDAFPNCSRAASQLVDLELDLSEYFQNLGQQEAK